MNNPTLATSSAPLGFEPEAMVTLNQLVSHQAAHDGDQSFVTFLADADRDERRLSFRDLEQRGLAVAALLCARGLAPGDRVLIMLDSGLEFIVGFYGILLGGMVPVPVYPPARLARLEHYLQTLGGILEISACRAAIADQRLVPLVGPRLPASLVMLSDADIKNASETASVYASLPTDAGFLQFTSGTTQRPRGVLLLQNQILAQIRAYISALGAGPGDVAASWLPLYHDLGLIGNVLACHYARIHLVLMSPVHFLKDPICWLRAISRYRAQHSAAPNFAYQLCVRKCTDEQLQAESIDLSSWTNAGCGGEVVSMATLESFHKKFAPYGFSRSALNPSFGLAENTLVASIHRQGEEFRSLTVSRAALQDNRVSEPRDPEDAWTIPGNGRALDGVTLRIVGDAGEVLADGLVGELWLKSPSLAAGYFSDGEATNETFVSRDDGRWLRTGDLGFLNQGDLYICGRRKDLMIIRGRNYYPQDLEEIVSGISGVRPGNVVAFSVEAAAGAGEDPVMVCEFDERAQRPPAEIRGEVIEAITSAFQLALADVIFVAKGALPKTSSGKLQRSLVKQAFQRGDLDSFAPPGKLSNLWLKLRLGLSSLRQTLRGTGRGATTAPSPDQDSPATASGVDSLDPRIVEALRAALPEATATPSPRQRVDALGLGSMELMELWVAVERLYDAKVPDAEWSATQTLGEVQLLVERHEGTRDQAGATDAVGADPGTPLFVRELLESQTADIAHPIEPWRPPLSAPIAFTFLAVCSQLFWKQRSTGTENLPADGSFILAGNHESYLDGAWVRNTLNPSARPRLVAMAWEGSPRFTRWFVAQMDSIPIDPTGNFRGAMQAGLDVLKRDKILIIFPEGSRTHTGQMARFRPGIGLLGLLSQRPIVPFRIKGGFEIYPRTLGMPRFFSWRGRGRDRLEICYAPPIAPPPHDPARTWAQARALVKEVRTAVEAL